MISAFRPVLGIYAGMFGVAVLVAALPCTGVAQTFDQAKLDAFLDRLDTRQKAMGSLVLAKDGAIIYSRAIGYGQMSAAERKPLTPSSRFGIASITKTFTAVMVLQLVEEGRLSLTDPLEKFFPQVPNAAKITIEQILSHRSGIPNVMPARDSRRNAGTRLSREEMLALIVNEAPEFEPDTRQSYSNSGYFILGLVVEKVTGKSYADALQERITARIGLHDTYLVAERIDVSKRESLTYWRLGDEWKPGRETHPVIFEIVSTPSDMARFVAALFERKLISQPSLDKMTTIRDGEGLGIVTFEFAGRKFYGNTGGGDNYGTWLAYQPEEKLAISYATNAKVYPVAKIISGVADIYFQRPFQIPALESIDVSPEILDQYVGAYSLPGGTARAIISRDGATLFFQPPGESNAVALEATSEDEFQIEGVAVFKFDIARKQVTVKRRGGERVFSKVE